MLKIKFNCLVDAFSAVILAYNGEEVLLEIPENLMFIKEDYRLTRFINDRVFRSDNDLKLLDWDFNEVRESSFGKQLEALETLHAMSPNNVYSEKIYAAVPNNIFRDFANLFKGRPYWEVSTPSNTDIFKDGIHLNGKYSLKQAPAYRFNYSRLSVALIKTVKDLGGSYQFCDGQDAYPINWVCEEKHRFQLYHHKMEISDSPLKAKALYIPNGVYMFRHGNDFYITSEDGVSLETVLPNVLEGMAFDQSHVKEKLMMDFYMGDLPLESFIIAQEYVQELLPGRKLKDLKNLRLNGSNFEFSPSMADVVGYADYYYDMVKRQGINVDTFKNAVFDYGTHIDEIVNTTFDLYPEYHNGQKAFDEAVRRYKESELI